MSENTSAHTVRPLADRVVVRRLTEEEAGTMSASGIIIPETVSKEKPEQGIVIAVGQGRWDEDGAKRIPMEVKEGDRVLFSKYGPDEVEIGGSTYYVVSESHILAIIN